MFRFYFGKGDTISLHAETQRDAVKKFQNMLPGIPFITDGEMKKNKARELEGLIRVAQEAEAARQAA